MADRRWWTGAVAVVVTAWLWLISEAEAGEYCYSSGSSTYCASGCCGSLGSQYCCDETTVWIVIGSVLGGLFLVSVIIVVACYCIKRKGKPGRVIHPSVDTPSATNNVTVVYTGTTVQYPGLPPPYVTQPMGAQPMPPPPPPYGQYGTTPAPPANYNDPAYPAPSSGMP